MCYGADIRLRGKPRIAAERISAATNVTDYCGADIRHTFFSHGPVYRPPSSKPRKTAQNRGISARCTVAFPRQNYTVNHEHDTDIRESVTISTDGYDVLADSYMFVCVALRRPTPSTRGERCTCRRCIPRENKTKLDSISNSWEYLLTIQHRVAGAGAANSQQQPPDPGPRLSSMKNVNSSENVKPTETTAVKHNKTTP